MLIMSNKLQISISKNSIPIQRLQWHRNQKVIMSNLTNTTNHNTIRQETQEIIYINK